MTFQKSNWQFPGKGRRMRISRLITVLALAGLMTGMLVASGGASSHREAPLIANQPQLDNTDLYAWIDERDSSKLNIVSVYYPFEMPAGFPNGYTFSDSALYTINIDQSGDGAADLRYGFTFDTEVRNRQTFYSNVTLAGDLKITSPEDEDLNIVQTYDVVKSEGDALPLPGAPEWTIVDDAFTSPNHVGPATHGGVNFGAIMGQAVERADDSLFWAGQADDPFFADLGAIWDLAQLRNLTGSGSPRDALADMNAQAIVMQIPVRTAAGVSDGLSGPDDPDAAVGIWASNYRMAIETLPGTVTDPTECGDGANQTACGSDDPALSGDWVQVSRLGMPLSNEVIILLEDKDRWNRTEPMADAQFEDYYLNSHLAVLLNALFSTPGGTMNRDDLVTLFLTGIPGVTMVADSPSEAVKSDMLRINLAVADSAFPNGRTLTDDVVDVSLSVVALNPCKTQSGQVDADCDTGRVMLGQEGYATSGVGDGVDTNDRAFRLRFPFVSVPHSGFAYHPERSGD
jgi:hypothetical protein